MPVASYISPKAAKGKPSGIAAGEELTTDYALFDDNGESMTCQCGTRSCRGTITGQDWQRPDLQRRYGPYFSWYLLRRFRPHWAPEGAEQEP